MVRHVRPQAVRDRECKLAEKGSGVVFGFCDLEKGSGVVSDKAGAGVVLKKTGVVFGSASGKGVGSRFGSCQRRSRFGSGSVFGGGRVVFGFCLRADRAPWEQRTSREQECSDSGRRRGRIVDGLLPDGEGLRSHADREEQPRRRPGADLLLQRPPLRVRAAHLVLARRQGRPGQQHDREADQRRAVPHRSAPLHRTSRRIGRSTATRCTTRTSTRCRSGNRFIASSAAIATAR